MKDIERYMDAYMQRLSLLIIFDSFQKIQFLPDGKTEGSGC